MSNIRQFWMLFIMALVGMYSATTQTIPEPHHLTLPLGALTFAVIGFVGFEAADYAAARFAGDVDAE